MHSIYRVALAASVFGFPLLSFAQDKAVPALAAKPALTVTTVKPEAADWSSALSANGNIAAWQEAAIGTETNGLRLVEVNAQVGDVVKRGQLLARFSSESLAADLAQVKANIAEADAALAEARGNADRARNLEPKGMISAQQAAQWLTAEKAAAARLNAQRARLKAEEVRMAHTRVTAPDNGVISQRNATVGAVPAPGVELFRLIRQNRLEWRAEVTASELQRIAPGQAVKVTTASGAVVEGKVRLVAPTVDPQTRNALVYVDLFESRGNQSPAKAGMFAKGDFELGRVRALTVPASAVLARDGFSWVFSLTTGNRVAQTKVVTGRRTGDRVEIMSGIDASASIVATGAGFLNDGDVVRVVSTAAPK